VSAIFAERVRVRAYECDSLGHLNNSVYIQYLLQATLDAGGVTAGEGTSLTARKLVIEYQTPARYGDELDIATWIIDSNDPGVVREYAVTRAPDGAKVVAARIEWDGPARRVHAGRGLKRAEMPPPLKPFAPPSDNGARPFRLRQVVRRYELDLAGRVGVAGYFNWLEEATFRAAKLVGWPLERMRAKDFITLQYRHDAEFYSAAGEGDEVEIVSRLIEVRRVRGTWIHEIRRAGTDTVLMRDYSTGAFLDWSGKVRAAPPEMMEALVRGERGPA
jgi:acyl-CoA thioesterase FadM